MYHAHVKTVTAYTIKEYLQKGYVRFEGAQVHSEKIFPLQHCLSITASCSISHDKPQACGKFATSKVISWPLKWCNFLLLDACALLRT